MSVVRYGARGSIYAHESVCDIVLMVPTVLVESRLIPFLNRTLPESETMPLDWTHAPDFKLHSNNIIMRGNTPEEIAEILASEAEAREIDEAFSVPCVDAAPEPEDDSQLDMFVIVDHADADDVGFVPDMAYKMDAMSSKMDEQFVDDTVISGMFAGSESSSSMIPSLDEAVSEEPEAEGENRDS